MSITSLDNHLHRFCGGRYQQAAETVTIRLSGMAAEVERGLYRCSKCGDEQRTVEQREAAEKMALDRIRTQHALLAPKEIRQLRESLGLTAVQLGELLYGVPKGVVEGWERGRYLQNREADALLRSLRDRETLERRAAKAGVALPDPDLLSALPAGGAGGPPFGRPRADAAPVAPAPETAPAPAGSEAAAHTNS
ncbi:MAG: type II TA system antitoxin MqsA family protein [Gemmatirosa sp.]